MAVQEIPLDSIVETRGMRVTGFGWDFVPNWQYEWMEYLFVFSVLGLFFFWIYSKYYRRRNDDPYRD